MCQFEWFQRAGAGPRATRATTGALNVQQKHGRLEIRKHFFTVRSTSSWNNVPCDVKLTNTVVQMVFKWPMPSTENRTIMCDHSSCLLDNGQSSMTRAGWPAAGGSPQRSSGPWRTSQQVTQVSKFTVANLESYCWYFVYWLQPVKPLNPSNVG